MVFSVEIWEARLPQPVQKHAFVYEVLQHSAQCLSTYRRPETLSQDCLQLRLLAVRGCPLSVLYFHALYRCLTSSSCYSNNLDSETEMLAIPESEDNIKIYNDAKSRSFPQRGSGV